MDVREVAKELRAFVEYLNDPVTAETTDIKLISKLREEVNAVKRDSASKEEFMKLELLLREREKEGFAEGREKERMQLCTQINFY